MNKPRASFPTFEVSVTTLPSAGFPIALRPDEAERTAIAKACGVSGFSRLEADMVVRRWRRDGVEIAGHVAAVLSQPCVITLEPVEQALDEDFRSTFLPPDSLLAIPIGREDRELILDPEGEDPPEEFDGDSIDAWLVLTEWLNLAIDRFPRAAGAEFAEADDGAATAASEAGPFAILGRLKPTKE